jgi:GntR family transcriptional regulator
MSGGARACTLERTNPLPLWMQLELDLKRRIDAGEFESRFPGEYELVEEYGVSRHTVRDALRRLRFEGIVDSGRGRGSLLRRSRIEQPLGALYSLFRSVEASGLEQRSEVRVRDVRVDGPVAVRLERPVDTEFVYIERLRLVDGFPFALDRTWLPRTVAGQLLAADLTHCGLYDELAAYTGIRLTGGSEVITARMPDEATQALLAIPRGCAAMEVHRVGCLDHELVEWRETAIRGDRFSVTARWSSQEGLRMDVAADTACSSVLRDSESCPTPR